MTGSVALLLLKMSVIRGKSPPPTVGNKWFCFIINEDKVVEVLTSFLCFARRFLNQTCILDSGSLVIIEILSRVETSGYWVLMKVPSKSESWWCEKAVRVLRCFF